MITIILVLAIKAFFKKGTPFKGGMPSGHAAVSFSITTAISLWTDDARITVLCLDDIHYWWFKAGYRLKYIVCLNFLPELCWDFWLQH